MLAFSSPSRLSRRFQPSPFRPPIPPYTHSPSGLLRPPPHPPRTRPPRTTVFLPSPLSAFQPLDEPASAFLRGRSAHPRPYTVVVRCLPPLPAPSCRTSAFQPLTYPSANQQPPRWQQRCRIAVRRQKRNLQPRSDPPVEGAYESTRRRIHTVAGSFLVSPEKNILKRMIKSDDPIFQHARMRLPRTRLHVVKLCCAELGSLCPTCRG